MQPMLPTLETARLILRPCTREDETDLHTIYWNTIPDEMLRARGKASRPTTQDIRAENEYYLGFANYPFLRPFGRVLVVLKEGVKIGTCLIVPHVFTQEEVTLCADPVSGLARFGTLEVIIRCALVKAYRGIGYGTEAARALVHYGLHELHLQRILAETDSGNLASIRLMQKLGMEIVSPANAKQVIGMIER